MAHDTILMWAKKLGLPSKTEQKKYTRFDDALLENGFDGEKWSHGWLKADGTHEFQKKCIRDYVELMKVLSELY